MCLINEPISQDLKSLFYLGWIGCQCSGQVNREQGAVVDIFGGEEGLKALFRNGYMERISHRPKVWIVWLIMRQIQYTIFCLLWWLYIAQTMAIKNSVCIEKACSKT